MSSNLRIVIGASITCLVSGDNGYRVLDYAPATPKLDEVMVKPGSAESGGELLAMSRRNVTDVVRLLVETDSVTNTLLAFRKLEQLMIDAETRQKFGLADRVYLQQKPEGIGNFYRSEILSGRVELEGDPYLWQLKEKRIIVLLMMNRRYYWEDTSETEIPMTNPLETGTGGLTIYNPNTWYQNNTISFDAATKEIRDSANGLFIFKTGDTIQVRGSALNDDTFTIATGGVDSKIVVNETVVNESVGETVTIIGPPTNYVEIGSSDVDGVLPVELRLYLENTYNDSQRMSDIWVAHNFNFEPEQLVHVLEVEDANDLGHGTPADDNVSSGGERIDYTWSGDGEVNLADWTLTTALLNKYGGGFYRIIGRFSSSPSGSPKVRFRIMLEVSTIWEGPQITLDSSRIQDLGIIQLPPYLVGAGDLYPLKMQISAQRTGGGSFSFDFVQITPTDGFRMLKPRGYGMEYETFLVDDPIDDLLYVDGWSPSGKTGHYVGFGRRVKLMPGKVQRLYFLHNVMSGSPLIQRTCKVKAYYRPRRLVL